MENMILDAAEAREKNESLVHQLHLALDENKTDIRKLRRKLTITFWVIIGLSLVTFAVGMLLLSVPVFAAFEGQMDKFESLIAGGFGIADLIGLVLYKPVEKIQKLMGDMSQLILTLNCNQTQMNLRLIEMDVINNRPSIGIAAEKICAATEKNVRTIQKYFESNPEKSRQEAIK